MWNILPCRPFQTDFDTHPDSSGLEQPLSGTDLTQIKKGSAVGQCFSILSSCHLHTMSSHVLLAFAGGLVVTGVRGWMLMASWNCISQTTSHLTSREGIQDKVVSSKCIRTFSVRPFIVCTCSVVYSLLSVHLGTTGRQKQAQASTLWEHVIAANTDGLAVTVLHSCALL